MVCKFCIHNLSFTEIIQYHAYSRRLHTNIPLWVYALHFNKSTFFSNICSWMWQRGIGKDSVSHIGDTRKIRIISDLNCIIQAYPMYLSVHEPRDLSCCAVLPLVLLKQAMPCLCKQYRSRSTGFFRGQMIWICTVFVIKYVNLYQNLDQVIWLADNQMRVW